MRFFSTDSGLYKFISRLWDVLKLNFLWLICSLPIVTIGASTIAAYTITLQMIEDKEGYVGRSFFKAFKANFKQGMIIGPITVLFAVALYFYYQIMSFSSFVFVLGVFATFLIFIALIYTYPLLARYDNTVLKTVKNSMKISLRYFPRTLLVALVIAVEIVVFIFNYITMIVGAFIGPICIFMTVSALELKTFRKIEAMGGVVVKKTEEDLYNEEIEAETEKAYRNIK